MSMDSWFPNPHDKDIAQLEEGLAYRAIKSGNNWILPSGKNAANGDPVVLDGVFGYATAAIVGGTDAIVEDTNWKPYGDGGALGDLIKNRKLKYELLADSNFTTASWNNSIPLTRTLESDETVLLVWTRTADSSPTDARAIMICPLSISSYFYGNSSKNNITCSFATAGYIKPWAPDEAAVNHIKAYAIH